MDDGTEENAATRWVRDGFARLMAQDDPSDPSRIFSGWAADGYQHEDRTSHPLLGGQTGDEASDTMERRWRANFDLGRDLSAAVGGWHEVVAQHGEHLTMLRWRWEGSDFFETDALWVFEFDSTLTRLQRSIQFDGDQLAEALEVFAELADDTSEQPEHRAWVGPPISTDQAVTVRPHLHPPITASFLSGIGSSSLPRTGVSLSPTGG